MMEKTDLLLKKFIRFEFGNRMFYLPCVPANISIKDTSLEIDFADENKYAIVDGISCYYYLCYDAVSDSVCTRLKDYTINGLVGTQLLSASFPLSAKEFVYSKRDSISVVPKRDYSEVTDAFLVQHKNLDKRIVSFLTNHPELFDHADWIKMNDAILSPYFDSDLLGDYLPDSDIKQFRREVLGE